MKRLWSNYSLGVVYLAGWLLTWALHALFTYWVGTHSHGTEPWWLDFLMTSFENLASEYHQVGALILLARYFVFAGSPQSKDGDDEMKATMDEILTTMQRIKFEMEHPHLFGSKEMQAKIDRILYQLEGR